MIKKFNKLVRDNIPDIIEKEVGNVQYKILNNNDYKNELKKKLIEEVNEFLESESPEELADILEVVYALSKTKNISLEELENIRKNKANKNGAFNKQLFLLKYHQEN